MQINENKKIKLKNQALRPRACRAAAGRGAWADLRCKAAFRPEADLFL